jgi:hypothetical protein
MMMKDTCAGVGNEYSFRQLDTIGPAVAKKERLSDKRNASQIAIPSDIVLKCQTSIPENATNSRTMATMTETFTISGSEDEMTSSFAFVDSFEVHEGLYFTNKDDDREQEVTQLQTEFSTSNKEVVVQPTRKQGWPSRVYKGQKSNTSSQLPVAPPALYSSSSTDSWDESNSKYRQVSLLDTMVDEEEEEDDEGHEGDDELTERTIKTIEMMKQMTKRFHKSHDSQQSPVISGPKFAQGPLSHLRNETPKSFFASHSLLQSMSNSSASLVTTTTSQSGSSSSYHDSHEAYLKSVEKVEKNRMKNEKSITETKGLFESLKDLLFVSCAPENDK